MANTDKTLCLAHLNLGKARAASAQLSQVMLSKEIKIISINEPYTQKHIITGFPLQYSIINYPQHARAALLIHKDVKALKLHSERDIVVAQITTASGPICIYSIYCSPNEDLEQNLVTLCNLLHRYNIPSIILGDFNAKSLLWGQHPLDHRGAQLIDIIVQEDLVVLNNNDSHPSFQSSRGISWIDLAITNIKDADFIFQITDDITNSDHNLLELTMSNHIEIKHKNRISLHRLRMDKFLIASDTIIKSSDWNNITIETINSYITNLQSSLFELANSNTRPKIDKKKLNAPWWNVELQTLRKKVRALRRQFQKETEPQARIIKKNKYKKEHAYYKKKILSAKSKSFKEFIENTFSGEPYYKSTNFVKTKRQDILCNIMKPDGTYTSNRQESIETIINAHFLSTKTTTDLVSNYISYDFIKTNSHEISLALKNMHNKKAPGLDGLNKEIIESLFSKHPCLFIKIINICLQHGYFPECWKHAEVILFPKLNKDLSKTDSYRPICLLPSWGKLLDKIITSRLDYYLETSGYYHKLQFGFRKYKSTLQALENAKNFILKASLEKKPTLMIILDIKGAFNNASWSIIRNKLDEANVPSYLKNCINSFISQRKLTCESYTKNYNRGVPQGSCLGPKLWLLIINELLEETEEYVIQAFADDLCVLIKDTAVYKFSSKVQPIMNKLNTWANKNELSFNHEKCEFTIIKKIGYVSRIPTIKLQNKNIKYKKSVQYLGVVFDIKLNWTNHLQRTREKIITNVAKLSKVQGSNWGIREDTMKRIYFSIIEKKITYGAEIWWNATKRTERLLQTIQRTSLLKITRCYRTTSTAAIQVLAGIPPVDLICEKLHKLHKLKQGLTIEINNIAYSGNEIDLPLQSHEEPWDEFAIEWRKNEEPPITLQIYTDGSKINDRVGFAYLVIENNNIIAQIQHRIHSTATVFMAELKAIHEAIKYIEYSTHTHGLIKSDSTSALQAINSFKRTKETEEIRYLLKHTDKKFYFRWVKAHAGELYNEIVDQLAKEATNKDNIDVTCKIPLAHIKKELSKDIIKCWQYRWDNSDKGRAVYHLIPIVNPKRLHGDFFLNQVITEHGSFPTYMNRFFNRTDTCWCRSDIGSVHHLIYDCVLMDHIRITKFPLNFKEVNLQNLLNSTKSSDGIRDIVKQCIKYYNNGSSN